MNKPTLGKGSLALVALLFIGILLLANTLLRGAQFDLTEDRVHTLTDGTRNILRGMKEPVNLYLFFSDRTATSLPDYKIYGSRVRDLLETMAARSGGKLQLKVVDPLPFSEEEDRAAEFGIQGAPINASGDKLYLGLAGTNSTDGKEAIPFLDPKLDEQLEYDVAKLVHKLSSARRPVIGWLSSLPMGGEFDMRTGRQGESPMVYAQVEQLYAVRTIDPSVTSIEADVDVLVLVHPKNLPPAALFAIDQFAMRGGHILAFVDPNAEQDQSGNDPNNPMAQFAADKSSHLEPLLASWGVAFAPGQVVVDLERGLIFPMREGEPPQQHIGVIGFDASSVSKDVVIAQLDNINMATAGSLKPVAGTKLTFEPLIHTSAQAGLLPAQRFAMLSDPATLRDGFRPTGEQVVAARVSGNATSAFAAGPPAGVTAPTGVLKESAKPLNVIVIADSDLLADYMWGQRTNFFGQAVFQPLANNGELVWNALDNLAGSNDLISIRGRAPHKRTFDRVEELQREADAQFRVKELQVQEQLTQTEETLAKLQSQQGGSEAILSADMAREIDRFREQQVRLRKELRAVKAGLNRDIDSLGMWIKVINILFVPLLFAGVALLVASWHRRRRNAIAMLRKGAPA